MPHGARRFHEWQPMVPHLCDLRCRSGGVKRGKVTLKARIHIMLHVILGILIMVIAFFSF